MTTEVWKKWVEAGKAFSDNQHAQVVCPVCNKGVLESEDIFAENQTSRFERVLSCPVCGSRNVLLMNLSKAG